MNLDLIRYAVNSLKERKTRSFLTILSILIGIMAIFTLVSFGLGLSIYVSDISQEMGVDKLVIQPKSLGLAPSFDKTLSQEDLDFVSKVKGVKEVTGFMMQFGKVQPNENVQPKYLFLMGSPTDSTGERLVAELMTVKIHKGRTLKEGDKLKVVLGYNYLVPDRIFEKPFQLGQKILLNDVKVEVIGFYDSVGNAQDDSNIYMTYDGIYELFGIEDEFGWVIARVEQNEDAKEISKKVTNKLRRFKDEDEGKETFFVQTFQEQIEMFGNILNVLNGILVMIALISVFVSGINIMNTMYTAVLERTKDIGIMKAIGAKNIDILIIFIVESGALGLLGGVLGILLGYGIASSAGFAVAQAGYSFLQPAFPSYLIISCLLFAFLTGAGAGLAPAINASKQKPVDSLRYE